MTINELLGLVESGKLERGRGISAYCHANGYTHRNVTEAHNALYAA